MGRVRIAAAVPVASVLVAAAIVVTLLAVPDTPTPAASPTGSSAGDTGMPRPGAGGAGNDAAGQDAVLAAARDLVAALRMRPEELAATGAERTGAPGHAAAHPTARSQPPTEARTRSPGADDRSSGGSGANPSDPVTGPPDRGGNREQIVAALRQLLTALDVQPADLQQAAETGGGTGGAADSNGTITISGFAFGAELTVRPGSTVRVVNQDPAAHNVTASGGGFASQTVPQGGSATFTAPATPGRHDFRCTLHPEMTGTLVVAESPAPARPGKAGGR